MSDSRAKGWSQPRDTAPKGSRLARVMSERDRLRRKVERLQKEMSLLKSWCREGRDPDAFPHCVTPTEEDMKQARAALGEDGQ